MLMQRLLVAYLILLSGIAYGQDIRNNPNSNHGNKFEQLGTILPTPNEYRAASGAPGPKYWQQRADYDITCELDEQNRSEEHTSELQSRQYLVCRLLLEKKK